MFGTIIAWARGLSVAGRIVAGMTTLGLVGAVSTAAQPPAQPVVKLVSEPSDSKSLARVATTTIREITENEDVDFLKQTENHSSLAKGETQLKQAGVKGVKTITYKLTITDGVETQRVKINEEVTTQPVDEITYVGTYVAPKPSPDCDPNYSGGCVPNVGYDLDCPDIGFSVSVIGYDRHRFDRDGDGYGCESY